MKTDTIERATATNALRHSITVLSKGGTEKTVIKISLDDDCGNGHESFSLTADIYENTPRGWRDIGGGCCHEHILKLRPALSPFAALHLSDQSGVPMYAVENGFYWFQGMYPHAFTGQTHAGTGSDSKSPQECTRILKEHLRATDEQISAIVAAYPRSKVEFQLALEQLGFPAQWEAEARAAIAMLEQWTGATFESRATRAGWAPLTAEQKADTEHKRVTGYYTPEAVAARDAAKRAAVKAAKLVEIDKELAQTIGKATDKAKVERFLVVHDCKKNAIFYDHTNNVTVNWTSTEALYTAEDFSVLETLAKVHKDELPEGITFTFQAHPKY